MNGYRAFCSKCHRFRQLSAAGVCPVCDRKTPPDVHARTTVGASQELSAWNAANRTARGASFIAPSPRPDALDALTADVLAGLRVLNDADHLAERFGVPIPEAQLLERAANIAMSAFTNFRVTSLPPEPVTPIPAIGAKGG